MSQEGRLLYEAYSRSAVKHCPFWPELTDRERQDWDAAAESLLSALDVQAAGNTKDGPSWG